MAPRKYRPRKRKRFHKRRFVKNRKSTIQKTIGFPQVFFTKLKFDSVFYNFTSGSSTTQILRLNSVNDPDYSIGGGQPMFYDQLQSIYQRYQVYGAKIHFSIINRSTTEIVKSVVFPSNFVSTPTTHLASNRSQSITKFVSPIGSKNISYHKAYYDIHKILGIKKGSSEENLSSAVTTNPLKEAYLNHTISNIDNTTAIDIKVEYRIIFYIKFFQKQSVALSD